ALARAMREDEVVAHARLERDGDERRGGGDEAVDDDGDAAAGAGAHEAGHGGDLEPTDGGERTERVFLRRRVARQRGGDHARLVRDRSVVEPGAVAAGDLGRKAAERAG